MKANAVKHLKKSEIKMGYKELVGKKVFAFQAGNKKRNYTGVLKNLFWEGNSEYSEYLADIELDDKKIIEFSVGDRYYKEYKFGDKKLGEFVLKKLE